MLLAYSGGCGRCSTVVVMDPWTFIWSGIWKETSDWAIVQVEPSAVDSWKLSTCLQLQCAGPCRLRTCSRITLSPTIALPNPPVILSWMLTAFVVLIIRWSCKPGERSHCNIVFLWPSAKEVALVGCHASHMVNTLVEMIFRRGPQGDEVWSSTRCRQCKSNAKGTSRSFWDTLGTGAA